MHVRWIVAVREAGGRLGAQLSPHNWSNPDLGREAV